VADLNRWLLLGHLTGVIVWSASAVGAYWLVVAAGIDRRRHRDDPELERRDLWVRRRFLEVVWLEHAGLVLLLACGIGLALRYGNDWSTLVGGSSPRWLRWKLSLVFGIAVPFELYDIWLSHWHLPRLLRREPAGSARLARAWRLHDGFMWIGGGILLAVIPAIIALAVFRPL
jgi:hypothetical protein